MAITMLLPFRQSSGQEAMKDFNSFGSSFGNQEGWFLFMSSKMPDLFLPPLPPALLQ